MATKSSAAAGLVTRPSLTLKRRLNASPAKVYAAWTDPEKIARWFGPAQVVAGSVRADIDARVGGRYRVSFKMQDGEHNEVAGVYREMVPNRDIGVQLGVAFDAGARIAGDGLAAARRRRHAADAAP